MMTVVITGVLGFCCLAFLSFVWADIVVSGIEGPDGP
jgi:hypothetical protein